MSIETIYAWVTGPNHFQVAAYAPDRETYPGKLEPWLLDAETTNKICWHGIGHQHATAKAVAEELGWIADWGPVYDQLLSEIWRIFQRDGHHRLDAHAILEWSREERDEDLICTRNGFAVWRVAEDLVEGWLLDQEENRDDSGRLPNIEGEDYFR